MTGLSAVISAAGVGDPWERAAEVTEADPVAVTALAGRYREAAEHAGTAVRAAERADRITAADYVVDGAAVHDAAAATAATRTALGDGGEHAGEVARMLGVVAGELGRVKTGVGAEITALDRELQAIDAAAQRAAPMTTAAAQAAERAIFERAVAAVRTHGGRIAALVDGYDAVLVSRTRALGGLGYAPRQVDLTGAGGVPAPPVGGDPAANHRWWQSLTDEQRQQVLAHDPGLVGNLNGIPAEVRDAANRARLGSESTRIDTEITDTRQRLDTAIRSAERNEWDPYAELPGPLQARLEGLQEQRAALDAVTRTAAPDGRQLLLLDIDGHDAPRAAVAVGNVDTARHVAVFTPGLGSTVSGSLERYTRDMNGVVDVASEQLDKAGRADQGVAAVAWLGYDAPQLDGSTLNPAASVASSSPAQRGGRELAGFLDGINASRPGRRPTPDRTRTLLRVDHHRVRAAAHHRTRRRCRGVRLPGHQHRRRRRPPRTGWAPVRDRDPRRPGGRPGRFGEDPNHLDGVSRLSGHAETDDGASLRESVGHSEYLTPDTTSQHNIVVTVAGLSDRQIRGDDDSGLGDLARWGLGNL